MKNEKHIPSDADFLGQFVRFPVGNKKTGVGVVRRGLTLVRPGQLVIETGPISLEGIHLMTKGKKRNGSEKKVIISAAKKAKIQIVPVPTNITSDAPHWIKGGRKNNN